MRAVSALVIVLAAVSCVLSQDALSDTCILTKRGPDGKEIKYDINILSKLQNQVKSKKLSENWVAEELNVLSANGGSRDSFYYYINVCVSLVNGQENNVPNGAGVYQVVAGDSSRAHVAGTISNSKLASLRDGDLRYQFGDGEPSQNCNASLGFCPPRFSEIILFCSDVGFGEPEFADEVNHLQYLFVWNTCAACPLGHPLRDKCDIDPIDECRFIGGNSSLSTGSILLIIFLVVFMVYLTLGVLYNRFVLGARGLEQLPNHALWVSLCSSISDGLAYVLQCGRPSSGSAPTRSSGGTSVSYEKVTMDIEESSEEEDLEAQKTTPSGYN